MARILSVATHATDDPTKASLAFVTAVGAIGGGKEVTIALVGEAVYLAKSAIAKTVHGVGFTPMPELIEKIVAGNVPVFV
jgi:predicted peroxiredoxin